ncbi:hypothetical protein [Solirubrobacter soli]|uniref:hypothetical protein n=1 Tax=Solirubrobacter soli TaxID=363832 RepID=UPI000402D826|nr:hypothetical protein [Solirubrobacter soli]
MTMVRAGLFGLSVLVATSLSATSRPAAVSIHRDTRAELADINLAVAVATAQEQAGGADGLPVAWCGEPRGDDDVAHAATAGARIKVVYAFAADRPNRFAEWADALQADVAITQRFLSAQTGGRKALRFDMGTSCGPTFADIQTVALPGPRAQYADDFGALASAVRTAIGDDGTARNAVILADGLAGGAVEYGLGETFMGAAGERPGPENPHNRGGLSAILFSRDGAPAPGPGARGWWPEGFLHEITHTLGAVQWSAPHSTQPAGGSDPRYGHCWQGADVMCYTEDSSAAHELVTDCPRLDGMIPQSYDCGRDDYFNPAPPPDSYLATHWNTYDSAFFADCAELAPGCGGGELWVPSPPAATDGPVVIGTPRRGTALSVSNGRWLNRPTTFGFQWERLTARGWRAIAGATRQRYTPGAPDLGRRLRVTVIAGNADGAAGSTSAETAPVGAIGLQRAKRATRRAR